MEVELKLLIAPADISHLRRFTAPSGWSCSPPKQKNLLSIYFDSEDFTLRQRGIALRVRRDGRRWIQTVKGGGSVKAGLHSRFEIEAQVASNRLDFTKIDDPALNDLFTAPEMRGKLTPLFNTDFRRTIWLLESTRGDKVEMALDQGNIRAGEASSPISEVELELKAGNPAALYELALALLNTAPLHLENASKAERGYALCAPPVPPQPVKALPLDLSGKINVGEAFQIIAWSCIDHLQRNQAGLLRGEDVEYVHQMRVAMRRLRSAMGLFTKIAPGIRSAALIEEMRWLAGELSAARDWDVFATETLPPILSSLPDTRALQHLCDEMHAIRMAYQERAKRAASLPRYQKLLLSLGAWLNREGWRAGSTKAQLKALDQPILESSGQMLDKRHKQLLKHGRSLAELSAPERHVLRIAAKKLRYAAEFLAHLYPGKDSRAYLKALAELQDILGVLNDHVITRRLLDELQDNGKADALHARAIGEIMGWNACQASAHLAGLGQVWGRFTQQKPFWN